MANSLTRRCKKTCFVFALIKHIPSGVNLNNPIGGRLLQFMCHISLPVTQALDTFRHTLFSVIQTEGRRDLGDRILFSDGVTVVSDTSSCLPFE